MCPENRNEQTIGDSWTYSWELMIPLLNNFPKIFWCDFSGVWWYIESNISHHSDDLCQRFANRFVLWVWIHNHWYKLNGTTFMVISISTYRPLTKAILYSPEICGNVLNIFWGGIKPTKFLYNINLYIWSCAVLLEIVFYGHLFLVLVISYINIK